MKINNSLKTKIPSNIFSYSAKQPSIPDSKPSTLTSLLNISKKSTTYRQETKYKTSHNSRNKSSHI